MVYITHRAACICGLAAHPDPQRTLAASGDADHP